MERLILGAQRLGFSLTPHQVAQFQAYYEELIVWNKRLNLTAITDYQEVQTKHFLDSLTVGLVLNNPSALRVLDVGSGAGLPGVPLKILYPNLSLALTDSVAKKTHFLAHLVRRLGLEGVEVITGRAEELARDWDFREQFDLVVSRAVAPLATLAELTLPFCRLGGRVVAPKKAKVDEEVAQASRALATLGGRLQGVKEITVAGLLEDRALVVLGKVAPTPPQYPRRPGIPAKRPL